MYEVSRRYFGRFLKQCATGAGLLGHAALRAALARAQSTHAAASLIAQIRKEICPKPVRYVINTHFHYDHSQGTRAYTVLSLKPEFTGSRANRDILANRGAALVRASVERSLVEAETWKRKAAGAAEPVARFCRRKSAELEAFALEMRGYAPELPGVTFDGDRHRGPRGRLHPRDERRISAQVAGHAQTAGRVDAGVSAGRARSGPAGPSAARSAGPVYRRSKRAREPGRRKGRTLDEVRREVTPTSLRSLNPDGFGGFIAATAKYRPRPPGSDAWVDIAAAVEANVTDICRALEGR